MKFEIFDLEKSIKGIPSEECTELEELLGNETVKIQRIQVTAKDHVYVFYEPKEVIAERELIRLLTVRDVAVIMRKDRIYEKLTNAKQRMLYICGACTLTKADAEDVVEMVNIIEVEAEVAAEEKAKRVRAREKG